SYLLACAPRGGDEVVAVVTDTVGARLAAYAPGKPERVLKTFTGAELTFLLNQADIGTTGQWDAHDRLWFMAFTPTETQDRRAFNLATMAFEAPLAAAFHTVHDAAGNRFEDNDRAIT